MDKRNFHHRTRRQRITTAVILVLAIATFPAAFSRGLIAQTRASQSASPSTNSKGGHSEGIQVHGHWTIEVRNPDGRLVSRREFENALTTNGSFFLASVMGRQFSVGEWSVTLGSGNVNVDSPCTSSLNPISPCVLYEATGHYPGADNTSAFKTLTVSMLDQGINHGVILNGNATAQRTGSIGNVQTQLWLCPPSTAPNACFLTLDGSTPSGNITGTTISPVNLSPGQIIQVKVVISFS